MITFDDGTTMTWEEAAVLVEAEGSVYQTGGFGDECGRCTVGILIDWTPTFRIGTHGYLNDSRENDIINASEEFEGTPEERAVFMAAWFRTQSEGETS